MLKVLTKVLGWWYGRHQRKFLRDLNKETKLQLNRWYERPQREFLETKLQLNKRGH